MQAQVNDINREARYVELSTHDSTIDINDLQTGVLESRKVLNFNELKELLASAELAAMYLDKS